MESQESRGSVNGEGSRAANNLSQKVITANDVAEVKQNVHGRFYSSSKKISMPVVAHTVAGKEYCHQFPLHEVDAIFRPVESVRWDDNKQILRGNTPNGTAMVGVVDRGMPFDYAKSGLSYSGCIIPMSPERKQQVKKNIKVFSEDVALSYNTKIKNAHVLGQDVNVRSGTKKKRKPSQNRVMKCSAKDELKKFIINNKSKMTAEAISHLRKQRDAEWLHIIAYSLTNVKHNPQVMNNLGAARKQDNTRMMVIEKVPKRLSEYSDVSVDLQAQFSMLPSSQVVKDIAYEVVIHHGHTRLNVYQNIDVFSEYEYPKNTDQLIVLVVEALLQGQACHVSEIMINAEAKRHDESMEVDDESKFADENESGIANNLRLFPQHKDHSDEMRGHDHNLRY